MLKILIHTAVDKSSDSMGLYTRKYAEKSLAVLCI